MKVYGVEHKSGELKDNNFKGTGVFYDYYSLHFISNKALDEINVKGNLVKVVKIKRGDLPNDLNPMQWVGAEVDINFDDNKKLKSIYINDKLAYKAD